MSTRLEKKIKTCNKISPEPWENVKLQEGRVDAGPASIPPQQNHLGQKQWSLLPGKWLWVPASPLEAHVSGYNSMYACQLHPNLAALSVRKERILITNNLRPRGDWMKSLLKSMGRLLLACLRGGLGPSFRPQKQMQNLFSFVLWTLLYFLNRGRKQLCVCYCDPLLLWSHSSSSISKLVVIYFMLSLQRNVNFHR